MELVRVAGSEAIINGGLEGGDRLCISTLSLLTDGTQVRAIEDEAG